MAEQRKTDRRIVKTETAIKSAFIDLLKKKGFEAITVNDIVNAVNISRGTFYLHYLDKYDLLAKIQDEFIEDISENLNKYYQPENYNDENLSFSDISRRYFNWLLSKYRENAEVVQLFLKMDGEFSFINKLRKITNFNLEKNLYPWLDIENSTVPLHYIMTFIFFSDMYVVIEWLEGGCKESEETITNYILEMNNKGPYTILQPPQHNKKNE